MSSQPQIAVSVIIATRNRADDLRAISLPSLAKQSTRAFEVIVWDGSDNDASHQCVSEFAMEHQELRIRYFRAPRRGLAAQRNDAVRQARGQIIYFIDDDSEVSTDAVAVVVQLLADQSRLAGGAPPLSNQPRGGAKAQNGSSAWLQRAYAWLFTAALRASGIQSAAHPCKPGYTDYLYGCNMAFRREMFLSRSFDERLQRFAGYAWYEDGVFSNGLVRNGFRLAISAKGYVIHKPAPSPRVACPFAKGAMEGYNSGLVWWELAFPYSRWTLIPFVWARLGFLGLLLFHCARRPLDSTCWKRLAGYLCGLFLFFREEVLGFTGRTPFAGLTSHTGVLCRDSQPPTLAGVTQPQETNR